MADVTKKQIDEAKKALNKAVSELGEDYELPQEGPTFFKFRVGENQFRIMSPIITGNKLWKNVGTEEKPSWKVKLMGPEEVATHTITVADYERGERIQHFWAMIAIRRGERDEIGILEVSQKGIMRPLLKLKRDKDYGQDLRNMDIVIDRDGEGKSTTYTVRAKPPKEPSKADLALYEGSNIDLASVYSPENYNSK